jgi:ABC-2 type transport system ATP-binding protein
MTVVRAEQVGFWYGRVLALSDLDLELGPGITGILGPNGSGKTTLLRIVVGLARQRFGRLTVFDAPPWANPAVARRLGYVPETEALDSPLTAAGFVRFALAMKGVRDEERVARAISRVGAEGFAGRGVRSLSRGMRQRVRLAAAIAHDPDLLVLDEPLTGVDPAERRRLIDLLKGFAAEGRTLLVTSHVLAEVEALTSKIVLLSRGRLLAEGDVREIRGLIDRHPHTIRVRTERGRELAAALAGAEELREIGFGAGEVRFRTHRPAEFYAILTREIAERRIPVEELTCPDDNLEAVFRYLTQR